MNFFQEQWRTNLFRYFWPKESSWKRSGGFKFTTNNAAFTQNRPYLQESLQGHLTSYTRKPTSWSHLVSYENTGWPPSLETQSNICFFKGVYYYWISTHGKTVSPDFTTGYLVASTPLVIKPNDVCRSNDQIHSQSTKVCYQ